MGRHYRFCFRLPLPCTDPGPGRKRTLPSVTGQTDLEAGRDVYTAQSGIWQSAWYEWVPENYIVRYRLTLSLPKEHFLSWSPKTPFLYPLTIVGDEDLVHSYFAMRCFTVQKAENGVLRFS